jgi:hypothetical protein
MALFLCFFGDSALWDNILLVPGYPAGYSYFRPFRYRDDWVQKSLLEEIQSKQSCGKLTGVPAILGMRFLLDQKKWSVLPIRKAVIRYIDPMSDNQSVYFSMGSLYDFTKVKELSDICVDIDAYERDMVGEKSLFFRANLAFPITECENEMMEDAAWVSFVNLVASEKNLPLKEEAKRALFIRFQGLSRKEPVKRGAIHKSWSSGEIHGTILTEGTSYELVFYHRVPWLLDQHMSLKKSLMKYRVPSGNLELSRAEEDLTGNYQKHVLNVSALRPSGTWEEIIIELPEQVESQDGKKVYTANSHIPLKVKISHWHRFKQIYFWVLIVWVSLFVNSILGYILEGKTNWNLIVVSASMSVLAAIGVYMLQRRGTTK